MVVESLRCASCSAPVQAGAHRCDYCGVGLVFQSMAQDPRDYRPAPVTMCSTGYYDPRPGGITFVDDPRYSVRFLDNRQIATFCVTTGSTR